MDVVKVSKRLSYVLRHRPESVGITLDPDGWVDVDVVLKALRLTRAQLDAVVAGNDKQRFAVVGDRIRANQGHSVPVELGLPAVPPPPVLYHGTALHNLSSIKTQGLVRRRRHHVHLSADPGTARSVGARHGTAVVLTVDAAAMAEEGHVFHRSDNGVWLTDHVPAAHLSFPSR